MSLTVQDVIDFLTEPVGRLDRTVDTLKFGSADQVVTGIVTTFMATQQVIEQAVALGANLIISHEGTFYSHQDSVEWIEADPVYLAKKKRIEACGIAIYRFHDGLHRYQPDGIMAGFIRSLGWSSYVDEHQPAATRLTLPETTVRQVAEHVKAALRLPFVRVVGDADICCTCVGVLAGYRGGGAAAIPLFEEGPLELIIAGEGPEWETPEYVRDAVYQGKQKALIFLGHAESEEPGMQLLAEQLSHRFEGLPAQFVPVGPNFQVL